LPTKSCMHHGCLSKVSHIFSSFKSCEDAVTLSQTTAESREMTRCQNKTIKFTALTTNTQKQQNSLAKLFALNFVLKNCDIYSVRKSTVKVHKQACHKMVWHNNNVNNNNNIIINNNNFVSPQSVNSRDFINRFS
jgi:hypothetical protein